MAINNSRTTTIIIIVVLCLVSAGIYTLLGPSSDDLDTQQRSPRKERPIPVEVASIERRPIELRRVFSGTLEAKAEFVVAPKVSGRIEQLHVNISDPVSREQLVAELDSDEYVQAVAQAKADLEVAKANYVEAQNALEVSSREMQRFKTLRQRGVASESQFDSVKANELAKQSKLEITRAQVVRAESALESARIRLGYTKIRAGWSGGSDQRLVAERFIDEGETVSANTPLLRIVELDPITGVVFVTERDYARLQPGQEIALVTDAFPGERFQGQIERIAPVFKQATRQARVELVIQNPGKKLKPGMFIRSTVVLDHIANATIIPESAVTKRGNETGVFLVSADKRTVSWYKVTAGIQDGERVQIAEEKLSGEVVTLGQQLLDDGSPITIPTMETEASGGRQEKD
jgi:RND family efflux transporter MFP subunit